MSGIFGDESRFFRDLSADPVELQRNITEMATRLIDPNETSFNGFDEEFCFLEYETSSDDLDSDMYKSANLGVNRTKNRYSNVLPREHSRVKLQTLTDDEGEDYVNANYISGATGNEKKYISTQGPLYTTFGDFWRMIWEQEASVIVMLTKETENEKHKCDRYWPVADVPMTTSHHIVKLLDAHETNELTERKLQLLDNKTGEIRIVWQFQYTAWPDHDLPTAQNPMGAFLDLAHKVDSLNTTNGPVVVHCSAGIGRSGTFCAVHSIIDKLRTDLKNNPDQVPHFSILKTIIEMRKQRQGMVQTKDQYMFCYLTLLEESKRLMSKGYTWEAYNSGYNEKESYSVDSTTTDDDSDIESENEERSRNVVLTSPSGRTLLSPSHSSENSPQMTKSNSSSSKTANPVLSEKEQGGIWDLKNFASNSLPDRAPPPDEEEEKRDVDGLIQRFETGGQTV